MFLELIELSILAFRSAWLSMLALILMRMNIKGRYFNQIRAWDVKNVAQQNPAQGVNYNGNTQAGAQAAQSAQPTAGPANTTNQNNPFPPAQQQGSPAGKSDDLPF